MNKEVLLSRIAEAEAQLDEMRKELNKKEVWEPEEGSYSIWGDGDVVFSSVNHHYRPHGAVRKTKAAAEKARDEMRVFNRLLAYRDEVAPDYEPDWEDTSPTKWFIYFDNEEKTYCTSRNSFFNRVGAVYMPKDVVEELCRKLNSGEVVL